jgi:hypothetical protein
MTTTREEQTMEASQLDVLGPVDYLVVEFPADRANFSGEMAAELTSLIDRELVRVLDPVLLRKKADGSVEAAELGDVDESDVGPLRALEAELADAARRGGSREDRRRTAAGQPRGGARQREQLGGAIRLLDRRSGGQLVASGRIQTQALLAAIEADDATDDAGA